MTQTKQAIATIDSLWRYPVKSMRGEQITQSHFTSKGLLGDRAYALQDVETGYIVSAKHPRKWGKVLHCRATYVDEPTVDSSLPAIQIELPDGNKVLSTDENINQILSSIFERQVRLIAYVNANIGSGFPSENLTKTPMREANRARVEDLQDTEDIRQETLATGSPSGTFFDYGPIHILSKQTLDKLQTLYTNGNFDVRRFRPNIVVSVDKFDIEFPENSWLGQTILINDTSLKIFDPTPRCVVTTLAQDNLRQDIGILKTIAKRISAPSITAFPGHTLPAVVGVYAQTESSGHIEQDDEISL